MATLSRVTGKLFGGSAPLDEIGQFGSAKAGSLYNTQDVATIQSLPAYSKGWGSAIITSRNFPPIEEVTGVLKTISYQNCYLLQEGVPVYDINTEYSATSIVKVVNGNNLAFYISLVDGNIGNSLSDGTKWVKATFTERTIGEIVTSAIPLSDSGLHLLDGSLISGSGVYAQFVSYIANIYNSSLNYFCTEAEWQQAVSTYGVCGKFVYDSVNNTVRLPKITGFVEGGETATLGDLVEANIFIPCTGWGTSGNAPGTINSGKLVVGSGQKEIDETLESLRAAGSDRNITNSTVQPQSIKVLYYIVVAETSKTDIQVDIDEIATDLNGKADVDLSNINDTGASFAAGLAMPSESYVDLTLGSSGATYTAPANGWIYVKIISTGSNGWGNVDVYIENTNTLLYSSGLDIKSSGGSLQGFLPVRKGVQYSVNYGSATLNTHRFIYAQGSESEAS